MNEIVETDRKPALDRHKIDRIDDRVDLRQFFTADHAPQQGLSAAAIARRIFAERRSAGPGLKVAFELPRA